VSPIDWMTVVALGALLFGLIVGFLAGSAWASFDDGVTGRARRDPPPPPVPASYTPSRPMFSVRQGRPKETDRAN
jgi:hypothetical protein